MQSLARRAGVGRATLYRRVGKREQLLDEVVWWRARRLVVEQVQATAAQAGVARIAAVIGGGVGAGGRGRPPPPGPGAAPRGAVRLPTATGATAAGGEAGAPGTPPHPQRRPGQ